MIGVGCRMNELTVLPPGVLNGWAVRPAAGATLRVDQAVRQLEAVHLAAVAERERRRSRRLAELIGVLPDVDVLLAQRDVVQVGGVAVLAAEGRVAVALAR